MDRLRSARWILLALLGVLLAGVVVVVVTRGSDGDPSLAVERDGGADFPARGPAAGDTGLLQRAARAWEERDTVDPPSPSPAAVGETRSVLWAGPRGDRTLVVLARQVSRQTQRVGYYVEGADRRGTVVRQELREAGPDPVRLDATGWLLPRRSEGLSFRVARRAGTATQVDVVQPRDGVVDVAGPAIALAADADGYLFTDAGASRLLTVAAERRGLYDTLGDQAGAERFLDATLALAFGPGPMLLSLHWRGAVPGVGSDAVVVRASSAGNLAYGAGFGGGARLRFAGERVGVTPSFGPSNCAPQPKCAEPYREGLPVLLAGWLFRGRTSPQVLVVIGQPEVVRIRVRAGTVVKDLPAGASGSTVADLGLPAVPDDPKGGPAPSVVVHGETAAGAVVPALVP